MQNELHVVVVVVKSNTSQYSYEGYTADQCRQPREVGCSMHSTCGSRSLANLIHTTGPPVCRDNQGGNDRNYPDTAASMDTECVLRALHKR